MSIIIQTPKDYGLKCRKMLLLRRPGENGKKADFKDGIITQNGLIYVRKIWDTEIVLRDLAKNWWTEKYGKQFKLFWDRYHKEKTEHEKREGHKRVSGTLERRENTP